MKIVTRKLLLLLVVTSCLSGCWLWNTVNESNLPPNAPYILPSVIPPATTFPQSTLMITLVDPGLTIHYALSSTNTFGEDQIYAGSFVIDSSTRWICAWGTDGTTNSAKEIWYIGPGLLN